MNTTQKLKILKVIKIILLIVFIPIILFYLGIILPEYLACVNCNYEGAMGVDIWGNEVQCFGESKDFSEVFFQLASIIVAGFSIILFLILFLFIGLKKTHP
ncbi:hypothetical protein ACFOWA_17315 [Pedobacter lithocola]|uniref:DUF2752 domain-containing protein n=1 Tax=Pedobacter lithocola TaxID=1908239 RepID=A0ABV8PD81_9SPHI